jgi:signal peptidase I
VVVFDPAHEDDMKLVKRIVGMPGDTLEMRTSTSSGTGSGWRSPG